MAILVDIRPELLAADSEENRAITCTEDQALNLKKLGAPQGACHFQWYPVGERVYCLATTFIGDHLRDCTADEEVRRADAYTIQELYNILPKGVEFERVIAKVNAEMTPTVAQQYGVVTQIFFACLIAFMVSKNVTFNQ